MDAGALLDILGNENRRRILQLLSRKPCYVTEISEHLGVSPKAVIDHLRKLEDAGLIESQTDEQRRKYFHISQNLRLEVTLAPYGFGMKSAYPASPTLDITTCKYLSLEASRTAVKRTTEQSIDDNGHDVEQSGVVDLAEQLDELEDISRELSLAQRWVQGRMSAVLKDLSSIDEDTDYLDAEILAAVVSDARTPSEISNELDVPVPVIEECLQRLADAGILVESNNEWAVRE